MKQCLISTGVGLLLCFFSFQLKGQEIQKSQIRLSVSPILCDDLSLTYQGKDHLQSSNTFNGQATLSYYHPIGKGFGVNAGFGLRLTSHNINYDFKTPVNTVFDTEVSQTDRLEHTSSMYENGLYVFPLSLQKTFNIKPNVNYSIELGATANLVVQKELFGRETVWYENPEGGLDQLFGMQLENQAGDTRMLSYFVKVGLIKSNKRGNSFHANLVANYSPRTIASGTYAFYNLGYESRGTVEQNINYIGIELSYGLSLFQKK